MTDLYTALAVTLCASWAAFVGARTIGRQLSPATAGVAAAATCAGVVTFALCLRDHLVFSHLLPVPGVVIYGNALPPLVALLAGLAWSRVRGRAWRKSLLVAPMALLCLFQSYGFLLAKPPPLDDRWHDDVCRQTSAASCSAAAAATLLRAHGVETTEAEMAFLCLTRPAGTPMLGLYRGLKLKTAGTAFDVRAFRGGLAALRACGGPVLLSVRLDRAAGVDPRYEHAWGWTPGVAHTVVFYGFRPDGKVDIGDPAAGREQWRVQDLQVLWHGDGLRLVNR